VNKKLKTIKPSEQLQMIAIHLTNDARRANDALTLKTLVGISVKEMEEIISYLKSIGQ
jgi:hypothetical protein